MQQTALPKHCSLASELVLPVSSGEPCTLALAAGSCVSNVTDRSGIETNTYLVLAYHFQPVLH